MWKARALYLIALLLSLVLVLLYDDQNFGFTILYALLLMLALSFCMAAASYRMVSLAESVSQQAVFKGEELSYTLRLQNRTPFFYPRIECEFSQPDLIRYGGETVLTGSATPKGSLVREYKLRFPYRGVYRLGVSRVTVTDFMGLFRISRALEDELTLTVYPESDSEFLLPIHHESLQSTPAGDPFNEDYTAVADVRKHTEADSLRKVHWQLSAKRGELIAKNYESFRPDKTLLLVDTRSLPFDGLDRAAFEDGMISYVSSAVNYCMRGGLPVQLIYGGEDKQTEIDPLYVPSDAAALLASIRFEEADIPLSALDAVEGQYNLVVFLSHIDQPILDAVQIHLPMHRMLLFYYFSFADLPPSPLEIDLLESLEAYGAIVNKVEVERPVMDP